MSNSSGPQMIEFGRKGNKYWAQVQCPKCEAWLREMPDQHKAKPHDDEDEEDYEEDDEQEKIDTEYIYYWTCLKCGYQSKLESFASPGEHSPHPDGIDHCRRNWLSGAK